METHTLFTPMCSHKGKEIGSNSSTCGLILPRASTPYSILWNSRHVIFSVDGIPIGDFKNLGSKGIRFPKNQPMRLYSSLWDAEDRATRGGLVKTDWTRAPFAASYQNFRADACLWSTHGGSTCAATKSPNNSFNNACLHQDLDSTSQERMRWVQKNYMIYNYCTDLKRFPQGLPPECSIAQVDEEYIL